MGLSSLFSLGWILCSFLLRNIWIWFITGYGVTLLNIIFYIKSNDLLILGNLENSNKTFILIRRFLLSLIILRGVPPFIFFYLKVLILISLVKLRLIIVFILLLIRIYIIYVYLIIGFFLLTFLKTKVLVNVLFKDNPIIINIFLYNILVGVVTIAFI